MPEADRNATSTRGGRGKRRKVKPRGRPKKSGASGGNESPFEDDGSDYLEDSDGDAVGIGGATGAESDSDDETSPLAAPGAPTSSVLAQNDLDITDDEVAPQRSQSGKRKLSDADAEYFTSNGSETHANTAYDEEDDEETSISTPGTPSKRGRGGSRGRGRGRGASSSALTATPPPVKKRKLTTIPIEPQAEVSDTHETSTANTMETSVAEFTSKPDSTEENSTITHSPAMETKEENQREEDSKAKMDASPSSPKPVSAASD